ncbi:hypothetical protein TRFO_19247 [Tritrichomonas foetus]|uniref:Uncharacterized protein n=1 Tax=Tritrichomonas foetus TaxID=1144522 RepID=A0A1J4KJ43_9EUKA|nr:hypothetical protein TRFO_19247 [Tritrichomonas foetus]|eukprot:OHT11359.1 hypothetical protein TRFO_19247 [Tritrichomonas foetus]
MEKLGPLLSDKKLPTYVLVTKASKNQNLEEIEKAVDEYMPNIKKTVGYIENFDDDALKVFEWFEKVLVANKKKK